MMAGLRIYTVLVTLFLAYQCSAKTEFSVENIDKIVTETLEKANTYIKSKGLDPLSTKHFEKTFSYNAGILDAKITVDGFANLTGLASLRRDNYCGVKEQNNGTMVRCKVQYGPLRAVGHIGVEVGFLLERHFELGLEFGDLDAGFHFFIYPNDTVVIKELKVLPSVGSPKITHSKGIPNFILRYLTPVTNILDKYIFQRMNSAFNTVSKFLQNLIENYLLKLVNNNN